MQTSSKIMSILVVIILITTSFTTAVSAVEFIDRDKQQNNKKTTKIKNLFNRDNEQKNLNLLGTRKPIEIYPKVSNLLCSLKSLFYLKNSQYLLSFYTNYNGIKKQTTLKLYSQIQIDVNNDTKPDIRVRYLILPGIVKPFSLSINFKLVVTRLSDFPDENAFFEGYTELHFLGIILHNLSGDIIRFGFESPSDEEMPDKCIVTYKLVPNLFSAKKKVGHIVEIDPGSTTKKDQIASIFAYLKTENKIVISKDVFRIVYTPATKASISFDRTRIFRGVMWELKSSKSGSSQVDMYLNHIVEDNSTYQYVKDVPSKILMKLQFGRDGILEFNSFGESVQEVGICDDLYNPINKIYASGLATKLTLEWHRHLLSLGKASIKLTSEGEGISLNGHLEGNQGGVADFSAKSFSTINCSIELDIYKGYFAVNRTDVDLQISLNVIGSNNSILNISMIFKHNQDGPFEVFFDGILNSKSEAMFCLAGKHLDISDLYLHVTPVPIFGGTLIITMDRLIKEKKGYLNSSFYLQRKPGNITGIYRFDIINGVNITNLTIIYNNFKIEAGNRIVEGDKTYWFNFTLSGTIDINIAPDGSKGYIFINGNGVFSVDSVFERNGVSGGVYGEIELATGGTGLNFSWYTADEVKHYSINGAALLSLTDFHLWYGDVIDISIPSFIGSIVLEDASLDSGFLILEIKGAGTNINVIDMAFSSEKNQDLVVNISLENIHFGGSINANLSMRWENGNITELEMNVQAGLEIFVDNVTILFKIGNNSFSFISDNLQVSGGILFGFEIPLKEEYVIHGPLYITLTNANVYLHIADLNISQIGLDLDDVTLDVEVTGTATISLEEIKVNIGHELHGIEFEEDQYIIWANVTIGVDSYQGDLNLNLLEIGNIAHILDLIFFGGEQVMPVTHLVIENLSFSNGFTNITIPVLLYASQNYIAPLGFGLRFDNDIAGLMTLDQLRVFLPDTTPKNIVENLGITDIDLGDIADVPLTINFENITLKTGVFDVFIELILWEPELGSVKLIIADASGVDNLDIRAGFPDLADFIISLEENFEHFYFDLNLGLNALSNESENITVTYIFIDTYNSTLPIDLELILSSDFLNFSIDLLRETQGISLPYFNQDIGLKLDHVILQTDEFYIYNFTDAANMSIDGFFYLEDGNIYVLVNGSWTQIGNGEISLLVESGYACLTIDEQITLLGNTWTCDDGSQITLSGSFDADNCTLEIWWDEDYGNITLMISGSLDVEIQDLSISITGFSAEASSGKLNSLSFSIDSISVDASASVDGGVIIYADGSSNILDTYIDAKVDHISIDNLAFYADFQYNTAGDSGLWQEMTNQIVLEGHFNLALAGDLHIVTDMTNYLSMQINGGVLNVTDFYFSAASQIHYENDTITGSLDYPFILSFTKFEITLSAKGSILFENGVINADANITSLVVVGGYIKISRSILGFMSFSGNFDLSLSGDISIVVEESQEYIEITQAYGSLLVTNFHITAFMESFAVVITGNGMYVSGYGNVHYGKDYIEVSAGITSLSLSGCHITVPRTSLGSLTQTEYIDMSISMTLDVSGGLGIYAYSSGPNSNVPKAVLTLGGGASVTISNLDLDIYLEERDKDGKNPRDIGHLQVTCNEFYLEAIGGVQRVQYVELLWNKLSIAVSHISVSNLVISSEMSAPLSGITLNGKIDVDVPHASLYIYMEWLGNGGYAQGTNKIFVIGGSVSGGSIVINQLSLEAIGTNGYVQTGVDYFEVSGYGDITSVFLDDKIQYIKGGVGLVTIQITRFYLSGSFESQVISINLPNAEFHFTGSAYFNVIFTPSGDSEDPSIWDNVYIDGGLSGNADIRVPIFDITIEGKGTLNLRNLEINGNTTFYLHLEYHTNLAGSIEPHVLIGAELGSLSADSIHVIGPEGNSATIEGLQLNLGEIYVVGYFDSFPPSKDNMHGFGFGLSDVINFNINKLTWNDYELPLYDLGLLSMTGTVQIDVRWYEDPQYNYNFKVTGSCSQDVTWTIADFTGPKGAFTFTSLIIEAKKGSFTSELNFSGNPLNGDAIDWHIYASSSRDFTISIGTISSNYYDFSVSGLSVSVDDGWFSWDYQRMAPTDEQRSGSILIQSSGTIHPTVDIIDIRLKGHTILNGLSLMVECPYLLISWDVISKDTFPWSQGYLSLDSDDQPITFSGGPGTFILAGILNIFGQIIADGFRIEWGGYNESEGFLINDITGELNTECTIKVKINENWKQLWPILDVNQKPVADAGGPYPDEPSVPVTITFDFSGSYDPDGDINDCLMKVMWDWDQVTLDWVNINWEPFYAYPQHTYTTAGEKTVALKIKDPGGKVSNIATSTFNVGTETVKITGYVYDAETNQPIDGPECNAHIEIVGTNWGGFVNAWGYYTLPDLEKNQYYTLKCTADGYYDEETEIFTDMDKQIDFYITPGHMQVDVTSYGNEIHEYDLFNVKVQDENSGSNIRNAEVTYEYRGPLGWWWPVDYNDYPDIDDTNPKTTNYKGEVTFTAIEVDNIYGYVNCRVTVTHANYQGATSDVFKVWDDINHEPYFTSGIQDRTYSEGLQAMFYISAYDPDGDYLTFYDRTYQLSEKPYDPLHGYNPDIDPNDPNPILVNQDDNTCLYKFTAPNDDDTDDHDFHVYIEVTDGENNVLADFWVHVNDKGTCFLSGTKITMADKSYKNIEDIKIDDLITSYDDKTGNTTISRVTKIFHHTPEEMTDFYLIINKKLKVTPNHRIYVNQKWVPAGEIKIGDILQDINGEQIPVYSIEKIFNKVPTYNFEVDTTHSFFAEDILVHNGESK